ncbi:MAG: FUSC family protein, partial [Eubacterium sp.]|nr:FUSC family protein [Eubacterium sp.]
IMMFRNIDLEIRMSHSIFSIILIYIITAFGPHLANIANEINPLIALPVHLISIFAITILGCHNVKTYNQFVLVLGYLLLYGYDVSGKTYLLRIAGLGAGTLLIILIYYFKHRKKVYNRTLKNIFAEYNIRTTRTSWQIKITLAISTLLTIAELAGLQRGMWAGIAAMSVLVPFRKDITKRAAGRSIGNIAGGAVFTAMYYVLPDFMIPFIGIIGGVGTGFSAKYKWQSMFNSLGAMSMAVVILGGLREAVFYRVFNNIIGAVYGILFGLVFHKIAALILNRKKKTSNTEFEIKA